MKENLPGEPEPARRSLGDSPGHRLQRSTAAQPGRKVRHRKAAHPLRHYGSNVQFATTCSPNFPSVGSGPVYDGCRLNHPSRRCAARYYGSSSFFRLSKPPRYTPLISLVTPASLSASGGLSEVFLRLKLPPQVTLVIPVLPARTEIVEV